MALRSLLLLLAALALAGCGGGEPDAQTPSPAVTDAGSNTNLSGPDISGAGLDGEALSVADFAGKPVFVNVWSSW